VLSEYLTAAVVAALAGITGLKDERVPYWWRFCMGGVLVASGTIMLLYASFGLLLTGIANALGWHPFGAAAVDHWANGGIYGLITVAVLRPEILAAVFAPLSAGQMLAERLTKRFGEWLEAGAARGVARVVGNLQIEPLIAADLQLFYRYEVPVIQDERPLLTAERAITGAEWLRGKLHDQVRRSKPPRDSDQANLALAPVEYLRHSVETKIVEKNDATVHLNREPRGPAVFRRLAAARK